MLSAADAVRAESRGKRPIQRIRLRTELSPWNKRGGGEANKLRPSQSPAPLFGRHFLVALPEFPNIHRSQRSNKFKIALIPIERIDDLRSILSKLKDWAGGA